LEYTDGVGLDTIRRLGGYTLISLIEQNIEAIRELCVRYDVARLEVFGSATGDAFDPGRSDVDFLVEYKPGHDLGPWLAHYHAFRNDLSQLLGRDVDLVMAGAPRNPFFLRELNRTRKVLYAA
jgi:hypothetical protein